MILIFGELNSLNIAPILQGKLLETYDNFTGKRHIL